MASMNCPKCGTPNVSRGTFCGNCGYAFQADGAATSSPSHGGVPPTYSTNFTPPSPAYPTAGAPPPPPSSYPPGNMPSSPMYQSGGTPAPSYPPGNMSSSPMYPAGGSPPQSSNPNYPNGSMPPSPVYLPGGTPPSSPSSPSYPTDVMPTSQSYPTNVMPSSQNNPNMPPTQRRKGKKGLIAILVVLVIVILAGAAGIFEFESHKSTGSPTPVAHVTSTTAPTTAPATATPDVNATGTAAALTGSSTVTPGPTATTGSSTATPGPNATATTGPSTGNYSATQPGPGCDTNGGTWTPQGITNIACGTTLSVAPNARGYLYLQLPNNGTFSPNNTIGISASVQSGYDCIGLAEQDANTGYLAEYCGNGNWHIFSITSGGATVKTLDQSITSTRTSEQLSLALKGTMLTFTIDTEVHTITVSPIHPIKVAITFITTYGNGGTQQVTNFSYTTQ